jgi:hypothetical protein
MDDQRQPKRVRVGDGRARQASAEVKSSEREERRPRQEYYSKEELDDGYQVRQMPITPSVPFNSFA